MWYLKENGKLKNQMSLGSEALFLMKALPEEMLSRASSVSVYGGFRWNSFSKVYIVCVCVHIDHLYYMSDISIVKYF